MKWTDELIAKGVERVMRALNLNRMPTARECTQVTHSQALAQAILARGGFLVWARFLDLRTKESMVCGESICDLFARKLLCDEADSLLSFGYDEVVESMEYVVNGNRCLLHAARTYIQNGYPRYQAFVTSSHFREYDVIYCTPKRVYIIPREVTRGKHIITFGMNYSKWDKWLNAWNLILEVKGDGKVIFDE